MEKLTSIRLQPVINIKDLDTNLWCPALNFGRKKKFRFPIIFKNYKQAEKLYNELSKLKGKTIGEVKAASNKLYDKYRKYDYKNRG